MKYPNIIFFRLSEFKNIDSFINDNKNKFDCNINLTNNLLDLNNIYDVNYHLIVTFGTDKKQYKEILEEYAILKEKIENGEEVEIVFTK